MGSIDYGVALSNSDKFIKMMSTENWAVSSEVIKIIHDDSHKQVKHKEATQKDECDKEKVGKVGAAWLVWIQ